MLWQLLMFARGFVHAQWHQRTLERKSAGSQQGTCPDHWGNRLESERADGALAILAQGGFGGKKKAMMEVEWPTNSFWENPTSWDRGPGRNLQSHER